MARSISAVALMCFYVAAVAAQPVTYSLVGTWMADLPNSKQNPQFPLNSVVLEITITGETVRIADHHVYASGKEQKGAHTFQADGKEHPFEAPALGAGVILLATWTSSRVLDTIVTKDGKEITRVVYEVSPDGRTMTATRTGAYAQTVVFRRK